jgi:hypothetical protein
MNAASPDTLRVLYVAGLPRSGSTVLGCVLSRRPDTIFVGELAFFWRRFAERELCSCGTPLPECHFWSAVVGAAFGQVTRERATELNELEQRVIRRQRLLGLIPVHSSTRWSKRIRLMLDERGRLYRSICSLTHAEYVIDSGKEVTFGAMMTRLGNSSFSTIHLVRDPRGVAFSWQKQVQSDSEPGDMPQSSAVKTAARWTFNSLFVQLFLNRLSRTYSRVRYEDLVAHPDYITDTISAATMRSVQPDLLADTEVLRPHEYHLVGSNPGVRRNLGGDLRLRLDDEWLTRLSRNQQWLVTAICGGLMAAYDYPLRVRNRLY